MIQHDQIGRIIAASVQAVGDRAPIDAKIQIGATESFDIQGVRHEVTIAGTIFGEIGYARKVGDRTVWDYQPHVGHVDQTVRHFTIVSPHLDGGVVSAIEKEAGYASAVRLVRRGEGGEWLPAEARLKYIAGEVAADFCREYVRSLPGDMKRGFRNQITISDHSITAVLPLIRVAYTYEGKQHVGLIEPSSEKYFGVPPVDSSVAKARTGCLAIVGIVALALVGFGVVSSAIRNASQSEDSAPEPATSAPIEQVEQGALDGDMCRLNNRADAPAVIQASCDLLIQQLRGQPASANSGSELAIAYFVRGQANWTGERAGEDESSRRVRRAQTIADFDLALTLEPEWRDARDWRALLLAAQGEYQRAIADYDALLVQTPNDSIYLEARAEAKLLTGDVGGAEIDATEALRVNERSNAAMQLLGVARLRQDRFDDAWETFDRAARQALPNAGGHGNADAVYGRGLAALGARRVVEGEQDIATALAWDREVQARFLRFGLSRLQSP